MESREAWDIAINPVFARRAESTIRRGPFAICWNQVTVQSIFNLFAMAGWPRLNFTLAAAAGSRHFATR
jgi:hypothetical protein